MLNNIMTIYIKSIIYIREEKSTHQKAISLNAFLARDKNKGEVRSMEAPQHSYWKWTQHSHWVGPGSQYGSHRYSVVSLYWPWWVISPTSQVRVLWPKLSTHFHSFSIQYIGVFTASLSITAWPLNRPICYSNLL